MSSIRVNPYPLPDLIAVVEQLQKQENTATLELASGSRINQPSDDPAGAAQLVQINNQASQVDSFERSVSNVTGALSTADSTIASVETALQRAISLGVEAANGTESAADRADISTELTGIQNQLISLANTSYQGQYIFAGTATTQPFVADTTAASGVRYDGNSGVNQVSIGSGYQLQINQPGSVIFNGPGGAVFQSIHDLINAVNTNSGISAAVNEVDDASNYVTAQRVFYGNGLNQAQSQQTYLNTAQVGLSQQQNTVAAADIASVASQLVNEQTASTAALDAISKTAQTTLFDYLT